MPINLYVIPPPDDPFVTPDREPISPELALVDPELARRARISLPNPGEKAALARISAELRTTDAPPTPSLGERLLRTPAGSRWRWVAPGFAAATLVVLLVLADVRVQIGRTPASADTTERTPPVAATTAPPTNASTTAGPATTPNTEPRTPRNADATAPRVRRSTPKPARPQPQRLAWAPVTGASAYHVELFRGPEKVFEADTRRATLTLPVRWRHGGRTRKLAAGTYRWYVWPIVDGRQASEAVVQASLSVG